MGVLDQITDFKKRGTPEEEIIAHLRRQGISPREINDSLNHAKIKNAVTAEEPEEGMERSIMRPERAEELPIDRSISDEDLEPPTPSHFRPQQVVTQEESDEEEYAPQPIDEYESSQYQQQDSSQDYSQQQYSPPEPEVPVPTESPDSSQSQYQQGQYQQQGSYYDTPTEYYPQESYDQGYSASGEYSPNYGTNVENTDTMIEISEQVFSEKMKTLQKQIQDLNEFKSLTQSKVDNMSDRLKRLESVIDRLQTSIIEKIGNYGSGLETVKKEIEMMQDSFGKIVGDLADKEEHKHHTHHSNPQHKTSTPQHTNHTIHKKTTVTHKSSSGRKRSKK